MSKESFKPEESGYTPEEMSKIQKSRLLSDAGAVKNGVEMTPEGKLSFTEEQIYQITKGDRKAHKEMVEEKEIKENGVEWLKECSNNPEAVDRYIEATKQLFATGLYHEDQVWGDLDDALILHYDDHREKWPYYFEEIVKEGRKLAREHDSACDEFMKSIDKEKIKKLVEENPTAKSALIGPWDGESLNYSILLGLPDYSEYLRSGERNKKLREFMEKFRKPPEVIEREAEEREEKAKADKKAKLQKEIEDKKKELSDL